MEYPGEESAGGQCAAAAGLSTYTAAAYLHPEEQRQETSARHLNDEGPSHANTSFTLTGPHCRMQCRSKLIRVSVGALHGRRDSAMPYGAEPSRRSSLGAKGDIKSCYDRISHDWLLANVPMDRILLRKWLKVGFIEKSVFNATEEGVVQGGPISPILANFALDGLEKKLRENYPKASDRSRRAKANLIRWADDFIITGSSKELLETEVKPLVEAYLKERGLELSPEKTRITPIETGFDFLGQHVRRYNDGKTIVKPSVKNKKAFLMKVRQVIKGHAQAKAGNLIRLLNPIIRGWANYHRHASSKQTFVKIDNAIFHALWRWARRRHPNKPRRWVKEKYFHAIDQRHWVFCGEGIGRNDKPIRVRLFAGPMSRSSATSKSKVKQTHTTLSRNRTLSVGWN